MGRKGIFPILLILPFIGSACALMNRDQSYTSVQDDEFAAYAAQKSGTTEALDELGYSPSKSLDEEEQETLAKRMRLKRMERNIPTEKEREQYYNYRTHLISDDDRIAFLTLPTYEARDRWAMQRGIYFKSNKYAPTVRDAVSRQDIILGMPKDAVMESWGEPASIEVAGNRYYGNERWKYIEYVTTPEGYQKEERVVIFESGKVVGWKRN
jgi:hypothetical protein